MTAPILSRERVRLRVDWRKIEPFSDDLRHQTPIIWRGTDTQIELGIFAGEELVDISNLTQIKVEFKDGIDRNGETIMSATAGGEDLNLALTKEEWDNDEGAHAILPLTNLQTNLGIIPEGEFQRQMYCVISAQTNDSPAHLLTLGISTVILVEDGTQGDTPAAPPTNENLVPEGATYDGGGTYLLEPPYPGKIYVWTKGSNDSSAQGSGPALTSSGSLLAVGPITLHGGTLLPITADVRLQDYLTQEQSDDRYQSAVDLTDLDTRVTQAQSDATQALADAAAAQADATAAGTAAAAAQTTANTAEEAAGDALDAANDAQTTADAAIPLSQKAAANGVASLGSDGKVPGAQLPGFVTLGSALPANVRVSGTSGLSGTSGYAAKEDHAHLLPLATHGTAGAMSADDKVALDTLSTLLGVQAGFNGSVKSILVADGAIWVGGSFTQYGSLSSAHIARLSLDGRLDPLFNPGTGFTQDIIALARAVDGDIYAGSATAANSWKGVAGGLVWKLKSDGSSGTFTCPNPISGGTGSETLLALAVLPDSGKLGYLTPNTLRVTSADGTPQNLILATDYLRHLIACPDRDQFWVSSYAYASAGVSQALGGTGTPRGLKLVGPTGTVDSTYSVNAGTGAKAVCEKIVTGVDPTLGLYAIVGNRIDIGNSVDYSFGSGSNELSWHGFYKVYADGTLASDFDITLVMNSGDPIPFGVDTQGRLYFGGDVASINGTSVTANRLYRLKPDGTLDKVFDGFNGTVRACVLNGDNVLIVGGDFTAYGTFAVGRIIFLTAEGVPSGNAFDAGAQMADNEGPLITQDDPPDVEANPRNKYKVWRTKTSPIKVAVWDFTVGDWVSICNLCFSNEAPNSTPVNDVTFSPAAGTAIGGGLTVALSSPQFSNAKIYYTTDGTDPRTSGTRTLYTVGIVVNTPKTIKAYARQDLYLDSNVSSAQYDTGSLTQLALPTLSPIGGSATPCTVTIHHVTTGAAIHYSVDPTDELDEFATAAPTTDVVLNLTGSNVVRAYATKSGSLDSAVVSGSYNPPVQLDLVHFATAGDKVSGVKLFMGAWNIPGLTIRYTMAWGAPPKTPTISDRLYTAPIQILAPGESPPGTLYLKAFASAPGYLDSTVASAIISLLPGSLTSGNSGSNG